MSADRIDEALEFDRNALAAAGKPGRVRWTVLGMLFLVTVINYADRATLSTAAPLLTRDLGIDKLQLGFIMSAWGTAYVIAQMPGGWLLDRFGTARVYFWAIVLWSLFTAAQGLAVWTTGAAAISSLFAFRFMVGLTEGPSFPGNARTVAAWFPAKERGTASAIFNSAQYAATALFAPIMGWVVGAYDWPWLFVFMGILGAIMAAIWAKTVYEPRRHPRLGQAELLYIAAGGAMVDGPADAEEPQASRLSTWIQLKVLLGTPSLLGLYLSQYFINTLTFFFTNWFTVYLVEERGLSIVKAGLFVSLPAIAGFVGGILGGVLSDGLLRRGLSITAARKIPIVLGMTGSLAILGCVYAESNAAILFFMTFAFFGKGLGSLGWAVMSDVAPRECAGLSGGIFNMFGNMSSIVTPLLIGFILHRTGSFDLVLMLVAASAVAAALCYLVLVGQIKRVVIVQPAG
jgi:MFS transporter, ACS family, glucarate transporter